MNTRWLPALIAAVCVFLPTCLVFGDSPVMEKGRSCSLTLSYREHDDGHDPVAGAEFTILRIAVQEMYASGGTVRETYRSLIRDRNGKAVIVSPTMKAADAEEAALYSYGSGKMEEGCIKSISTDRNGSAVQTGLPPGIYLVIETKPAPEHLPSAPFLVALPHSKSGDGSGDNNSWDYDGYAEPKPVPCGDLVIVKYVRGSAVKTKKSFHFQVYFSTGERLHYRKSNGKEGYITSGKLITLKQGQSVRIDTIPAGTDYRVSEKEANTNGFRTSSTGSKGRITRTKQSKAVFVNHKMKPSKKVTPTAAPSAAPTRPGTVKPSPVRTGDLAETGLYLAAAVLSLLAVLVAVGPAGRKRFVTAIREKVRKRKNGKENDAI